MSSRKSEIGEAEKDQSCSPLSLQAWDKYRPDLVNQSVIKIHAVRFEPPFEGDLQLVIALARQPDLMGAARKAAQLKK